MTHIDNNYVTGISHADRISHLEHTNCNVQRLFSKICLP